jgi:hypothetical protein
MIGFPFHAATGAQGDQSARQAPAASENPPYPTDPGGRPRKLDDAAKRWIARLVVKGHTLSEAAAFVACDRDTILNERKRDPQFDAAVRRAKQMRKIEPLDVIYRASKTSWRAAAWLIEHTRRIEQDAREACLAREEKEPVDTAPIIEQAVEPTAAAPAASEAPPPRRRAKPIRPARVVNRTRTFSAPTPFKAPDLPKNPASVGGIEALATCDERLHQGAAQSQF